MLYCTGTKLAFIGWLCGTETISSVAMPVSKYGEGMLLEIRLQLAPAQNPTQKFGQAWMRGLLMFLDIIFMLFTLPYCNPLKT